MITLFAESILIDIYRIQRENPGKSSYIYLEYAKQNNPARLHACSFKEEKPGELICAIPANASLEFAHARIEFILETYYTSKIN